MKNIAALAVALTLAGCATEQQTWKATVTTDEFTDKTTIMVTTGDSGRPSWIVTQPQHLYPVIHFWL